MFLKTSKSEALENDDARHSDHVVTCRVVTLFSQSISALDGERFRRKGIVSKMH